MMKNFDWRILLGILMIIIYLSMAYMLTLTNIFNQTLSQYMRILFGIVFAIYGFWRGYRLWKSKS